MKKFVHSFVIVIAIGLLFTSGTQLGQAQQDNPPPEEVFEEGDISIQAAVQGYIPVQGRVTDAAGNPLTGTHQIAVRIYEVPTGGSPRCSTSESINLTNGLFTLNLLCPSSVFLGNELYAGVSVDSDPEMTPRLTVYPVPFAMSLKPGAVITNSTADQKGLEVKSDVGGGAAGAALWVENRSTANGIGEWVKARGTDSALVIENTGSGPLLKAFGGDGGEDEIRIANNGTLMNKADSYIFVPGIEAKSTSGDAIINYYGDGSISIQYTGTGSKGLVFGIPLPAVLYGQPVKVEEVTIYYDVSNSATSITRTQVIKQLTSGIVGGGPAFDYLADNTTARNSTSYTSYSLSVDQWLSSETGFLTVALVINYTNTAHFLDFGGVRVRLGHHPLY
ncbi:MAG: hypothetical protein N2646_03145 [Bellilinea sp.]|nr:hypothetical protein [Bellilinea sp.]